jgi:6-phosphogluconate dehydrogenase (decarboxylating)
MELGMIGLGRMGANMTERLDHCAQRLAFCTRERRSFARG